MNLKKWKLVISLLLVVLAISMPPFNLGLDVATLLTVFSLLFAILMGFFIATATTNYLRLQSLIAEEDAGLIAINNLVRNIAPQDTEKIVEAIDNYAIASLSFELTDYIDKTDYEFENLTRAVDEVNFNNLKGQELIASLHEKKNSLYQTRQEVNLVARRIVTPGHWIVVSILGIVVGFLSLSLGDGELLSSLISAVLLVAIYLVLTLLYEVDNNRFLEQALTYQNSQQIFQSIGKPSYYVATAIKSGRIGEPKETYRTGYYNSFQDKEIKLVEKK